MSSKPAKAQTPSAEDYCALLASRTKTQPHLQWLGYTSSDLILYFPSILAICRSVIGLPLAKVAQGRSSSADSAVIRALVEISAAPSASNAALMSRSSSI